MQPVHALFLDKISKKPPVYQPKVGDSSSFHAMKTIIERPRSEQAPPSKTSFIHRARYGILGGILGLFGLCLFDP